MLQILVRAAPLADPALAGQARVIREGTRNRYITEDPNGVAVPLTAYYQRKLSTGELCQVDTRRHGDHPQPSPFGVTSSAREDDDR